MSRLTATLCNTSYVANLPYSLCRCATLDLWTVVWGIATNRTFATSSPESPGPIATDFKFVVVQLSCLWYLLELAGFP